MSRTRGEAAQFFAAHFANDQKLPLNELSQRQRARHNPHNKITFCYFKKAVEHLRRCSYLHRSSIIVRMIRKVLLNIFCTSRLLTHSGFFSRTGSDTFRSVLIYGKEQESRKKIFHNSAKQFIFLRGFDRRNTHRLGCSIENV